MYIKKRVLLGVTIVASVCLVAVSMIATATDAAETGVAANSSDSCSTRNVSTNNKSSQDMERVARKNDAPTEVGEEKVVAELEDGSVLYCELVDRHTETVEE